MIKLTEETTLTLLSYHCHSLVPIGVSCAGVLLESHVSLSSRFCVILYTCMYVCIMKYICTYHYNISWYRYVHICYVYSWKLISLLLLLLVCIIGCISYLATWRSHHSWSFHVWRWQFIASSSHYQEPIWHPSFAYRGLWRRRRHWTAIYNLVTQVAWVPWWLCTSFSRLSLPRSIHYSRGPPLIWPEEWNCFSSD